MKKLLLIIAAFTSIYFIFGCTDTNQLAGPDNSAAVEESASISDFTVISLPRPYNKSLRKSWTAGEYIPVGGSGSIHIQEQYEGGIHGLVSVNATINFSPGSFNPDISYYEGVNYQFTSDSTALWSSLSVEDDYCAVNFTPHIMFNQPAILNMTFTGVDLTNVDVGNIRFVYYAGGGEIEPVKVDLRVDISSGTIELIGAQIEHFSRYTLVN